MKKKKAIAYKKLLSLSCCLIIFSACNYAWYGHNFVKGQQSALFRENLDTHIDTLIHINGYYAGIADDSTYLSYSAPFYFCKDGGFAKVYFKDEYLYLKKKNIDVTGKYYLGSGAYSIKGDTLCADWYMLDMCQYILAVKYKFKIIDRNTLLLFEFSDNYSKDNGLGKLKSYNKDDTVRVHTENQIYKFIPVTGLPSSDLYIKRKKWMWEDKEEWKRYKKSLKAKNKKK